MKIWFLIFAIHQLVEAQFPGRYMHELEGIRRELKQGTVLNQRTLQLNKTFKIEYDHAIKNNIYHNIRYCSIANIALAYRARQAVL